MYTRAERAAQLVVVAVALVFALAVGSALFGSTGSGGALTTASPAPPAPPAVTFTHDTCCTQTARGLAVVWSSSEKVVASRLTLVPDPGFACTSTLDPSGTWGVLGCAALLRGATDYVADLSLVTARGTFPFRHAFRTMGDVLGGVRWFTEFEDPSGDPLACAAASVRIVESYTTGADPVTATQILSAGTAFNRSRDPGIDPVAIATMQRRLDPRNSYHYYRLATREEATRSAAYWLARSGKPVHVISLAGQHDPVLIGFGGSVGASYDDPATSVTKVVVLDPQRGDMRPETAAHRPDKYRTPGFQTGQPIGLDEWYRDDWWLGYPYQAVIRMPDGSSRNVERNDGAYPTPHWGGMFVILVDDADAAWPPDKEGRVSWR